MSRAALEVADIFRDHGAAWRDANRGHVSLGQLKVMTAIETAARRRSAAMSRAVRRACTPSSATIAAATDTVRSARARRHVWIAEREAELLPVPYFHVVFTLPGPIANIAYQNKRVIYDLLFKASAQTTLTIAADPKHLGAKVAITSVLHTWGSAMTHHPHVHMIVPGGGLSTDASRWIACRPNFFLPVLVFSRLFRRLMLDKLAAAHEAGKLKFFGDHAGLPTTPRSPLSWRRGQAEWVVYAKEPFAGPKAVLAYLSRYTHRVAIANSRLVRADATSVTFKFKDYRVEGPGRYTTMTLRRTSSSGAS